MTTGGAYGPVVSDTPSGDQGIYSRDIAFGVYPSWFNDGDNPPTWWRPTFWLSVIWRRGWYQNDFATKGYRSPVDQPNWTMGAPAFVSAKTLPTFTFRKWIGTWSTKADFHQDAQRYPGPNANASPMPEAPSATLQRMRSPKTPRIRGGRFDNLTRWGRAPSYGSRTITLPTAPAGQNSSDYGGNY